MDTWRYAVQASLVASAQGVFDYLKGPEPYRWSAYYAIQKVRFLDGKEGSGPVMRKKTKAGFVFRAMADEELRDYDEARAWEILFR